jgi:hypothetical protein
MALILDANNVRMVEAGNGLGLLDEAPDRVGIGETGLGQDFYGYQPRMFQVDGQKNFGGAAAAQKFF